MGLYITYHRKKKEVGSMSKVTMCIMVPKEVQTNIRKLAWLKYEGKYGSVSKIINEALTEYLDRELPKYDNGEIK